MFSIFANSSQLNNASFATKELRDILTSEGINIKDMIETPCTATEDEIQMMLDEAAEGVLSEAEATEFFARDIEINEFYL